MRYIISFMFLVLSFVPSYAGAQSERIAAVVNDDIITESELANRVTLIISSSGLNDSSDMRKKMSSQILGELIDEKIRLHEAAQLKIIISEKDIDKGISVIASQNGMEAAKFIKMFELRKINIETLRDQVRAQQAWGALVNKKIRPTILVSDADVETYISRLKDNIGTYEYLVAEIFLSFDKFSKEKDTVHLANKLMGQLKAGTVPFSKIAAQFSGSAGANKGGDMGWVQKGQFSDEIENAISKMRKGDVSKPIRGTDGYHIILLRDKRIVTDKNIPSEADIDKMIGFERLERAARGYFFDLKSSSYIDIRRY